jgi:hypothetical protein
MHITNRCVPWKNANGAEKPGPQALRGGPNSSSSAAVCLCLTRKRVQQVVATGEDY